MLDLFFFGGLPYVAVFVCIVGSIWRYRSHRFGYSALSSQFLESRRLLWGSIPWHAGILTILLGHAVALCVPGLWQAALANRTILLVVEGLGLAAAVLCVAGLATLLARRMTSGLLQRISTPMDFAVVTLLLVQVLLGMWVALAHRWGAAWGPPALAPYLLSLIRLQPDLEYVSGMPGLVKLHVAGAWVLVLVVPFSRLVHVFSLPLEYLWRPPQKVVWANAPRFAATMNAAAGGPAPADVPGSLAELDNRIEGRRAFLRAGVGLTAAAGLLGVGVADKLVRYFRGPDVTPEEEAELVSRKLDRLKLTAEQRALELERLRATQIRVGRLGELTANKGKYFIDYQMRPALAFLAADGLPLLISAKCTHLGCTVGSDLDAQGRILCPCHISYFDLKTGKPNADAPAKAPLAHLGWTLTDDDGNVLMAQAPDGSRTGSVDPAKAKDAHVCIAKRFETEVRA